MFTFISLTGRKYPGEKRTCLQCGKEEVMRKDRKTGACKNCLIVNRKALENCFVLDSRGNKCAAVYRKCQACGDVKLVRKSVASPFCKKCIQLRKKSCISDKDSHYIDVKGNKVRTIARKCKIYRSLYLIF